MDNRYKYTISNTERKHHHLVVSPETHEAIKTYAESRGLTITEATQKLLTIGIKHEIGKVIARKDVR